jgi:hypothetical protein
MSDARIALSLSLAGFALALGALLVLQPYSIESPWSVYKEPGQRYFQAALQQDSAQLDRLSLAAEPVQWALETERSHRHDLSVWAHYSRPSVGIQRGDTVTVVFENSTEVCPVVLTFLRHRDSAQVLAASPWCYRDTEPGSEHH